MNSKGRRLYLCRVSALLAGVALPNAALAHTAVARSLDLHALTAVAQYVIRKNRPYAQASLSGIRVPIAVSDSAQLRAQLQSVSQMIAAKNASNMLIASDRAQLQEQLQAIQQQIANRKAASKSSIGVLNSRAKLLRSQLQLVRKAKVLSSLYRLLD